MMNVIKQAVILAGGQGKRLRPFTLNNPKPMVPVLGKPFLEHLILLLKKNGIEEVVILTGYLEEKIKNYFGDGSKFKIKIKYSYTPFKNEKGEENESGLRLKNAQSLLAEKFLLMYCDNYWPLDLKKMSDFYNNIGALAMTTVYNNKDGFGEYGRENNVWVSDDGYVLKYDRTRKDINLNGVDIGFFILDKKILDLIPEQNSHFEKDILPKVIVEKQLAAYKTDYRYYFITNQDSLQDAENFLKPKKAVFLDRDGVINKKAPEHDYIKNWSSFEFLPGVAKAISELNKNFLVVIVSNQRGIARGLMTVNDLEYIHNKMQLELIKNGAKIDKIYFCPHDVKDNCECRKPKPGMLFMAASDLNIDLPKSYMIGDAESDIKAGQAAECKTILVDSKTGLLGAIKNISD